MESLIMERRAYDNKYLHRDFHATMDIGIAYVGDHFGEEALNRFLTRYVQTRYKPMSLQELETYFLDIYKAEEAEDALQTCLVDGKLTVKVAYCPALQYLNAHGGASEWNHKTTTVMYPALAELCGLKFHLIAFNKGSGAAEFAFMEG